MIEICPTACAIDSRLTSLADALDLTLVERDSEALATPTAEAWRSLTQGDLIRVRLGLNGEGLLDYGTFRVDECSLAATESAWRTTIHARDRAALLVEERAEQAYGYGSWPKDEPAERTYPSARSLAEAIVGRVGLGLIWDAPNYRLTSFTLQPDESASQAIARLLTPLRVSRRYYTDAWVDGENLVVRRRGSGANAGTIDCSLGQVTAVVRSRQPAVGAIRVYGATYVTHTEYAPEKVLQAGRGESGEGEPDASVRIIEDTPDHRVVETGFGWGENFHVMTRETEDLTFEDVFDVSGRWLGRVQIRSTILLEKRDEFNELSPLMATERKTTSLGYDDEWRLVLRDELTKTFLQNAWRDTKRIITRFEQVTPTDMRTTTIEFKLGSGPDATWKLIKGRPTWEQVTGVLQSAIRQAPDPEGAWEQHPDGSAPPNYKVVEETAEYYGFANGGGVIPQVYRNEQIVGNTLCYQIANDLAAESGAWLYNVNLFWPRPFPWRKGQRVTLGNLPGDAPTLEDAVIVAVHTRFDQAANVWAHDVMCECWRDT